MRRAIEREKIDLAAEKELVQKERQMTRKMNDDPILKLLNQARDRQEQLWEARWMEKLEEVLAPEGEEEPGRDDAVSEAGTEVSTVSNISDRSATPTLQLEDEIQLHVEEDMTEFQDTEMAAEEKELRSEEEKPPEIVAERRVEVKEDETKEAEVKVDVVEGSEDKGVRKPVHDRLGAKIGGGAAFWGGKFRGAHPYRGGGAFGGGRGGRGVRGGMRGGRGGARGGKGGGGDRSGGAGPKLPTPRGLTLTEQLEKNEQKSLVLNKLKEIQAVENCQCDIEDFVAPFINDSLVRVTRGERIRSIAVYFQENLVCDNCFRPHVTSLCMDRRGRCGICFHVHGPAATCHCQHTKQFLQWFGNRLGM